MRVVRLVAPPGAGAGAVRDLVGPLEGVEVLWEATEAVDVVRLAAAEPETQFLLVARAPRDAVALAMEGWSSRRFVTEPDLPGWWGDPWSYALVDDWERLIGAPLAQVCAAQWSALTRGALAALRGLPPGRWSVLVLERLADDPEGELSRALGDLGVAWAGPADQAALDSLDTLMDRADAALRASGEEVLLAIEAEAGAAAAELVGVVADRAPGEAWPPPPGQEEPDTAVAAVGSEGTPFSSAHTSTFAELLRQAGVSVLISTYKSGHLITARADGAVVNTEFTSMARPMGLAVAGTRLAVGAAETVVCYTMNNGLAPRVPSPRPPDVVYAPRSIVFTGDIAIHDMGYGRDGVLYFVNTRFSCLCRQDIDYSFVPVWRPRWISGLAAEDRCHLNGLAMVDGAPRYVTALARTDTAGGWRDLKGTGGVIVDITTNTVVSEGLSMPHSPRWHDGRLWVLESGVGSLSTVDLESGARTPVATLPGFTRGLSFIGPYALVGLSQVRESVFSSLPITATAAERNCGVWVVDTRSGEQVGFLKFEGMVQEIFDVAVLGGAWAALIEPGELTPGAYVLPDDALRDVVSP